MLANGTVKMLSLKYLNILIITIVSGRTIINPRIPAKYAPRILSISMNAG
jgi:hypothetical protein